MTTHRIHEFAIHGGSLHLDATHFPVLVATWAGTITHEIMDAYFELRAPYTQRADELGLKVVVITDATRMDLPVAAVRKYIGEQAKAIDRSFASMLGYAVIVPSQLLRGIVTAIGWFMGDHALVMRQAATLEGAWAETQKLYAEAGATPPPLPAKLRGGVA